jgi:putative ABC transport system permease protein
MTTLSIAIKNITRKPFRSIALILSVSLVAALLFAGAISMKGVLNSITLGAKKLGADLMVVPEGHEDKVRTTLIAGKPSLHYMPDAVVSQVRKVQGVKQASPQLFIKATSFPCCTDVDAVLIAFDPDTDFTVSPWLKEAIDRPLGKDEVIIGRSLPVATGDQMRFYGKELTVAGFLSDTGFDYIDHGVFMTFETARDMIRQSKKQAVEALNIDERAVSTVLVQLDPAVSPERAAVFVEYEIKGVKAIASQDVVGAVKAQLLVLLQILLGVGSSLWIVTLVLITVVFSMIVNERQRELGILRSLGAGKKTVFTLITLEAVIISIIGGFAGLGAGGGLLFLLKKPVMAAFKLPYLWPDAAFIAAAGAVTISLSIITGTAAVLYPAFRCSRMEPYEAIRKGE